MPREWCARAVSIASVYRRRLAGVWCKEYSCLDSPRSACHRRMGRPSQQVGDFVILLQFDPFSSAANEFQRSGPTGLHDPNPVGRNIARYYSGRRHLGRLLTRLRGRDYEIRRTYNPVFDHMGHMHSPLHRENAWLRVPKNTPTVPLGILEPRCGGLGASDIQPCP